MSGTISFNPYGTSFPVNPFLLQTQGYVSGVALDEPSSRLWLASGPLATGQTVPMWGGVPITETINTLGTGSEQLGPTVARATSQANTTGFSVFNQAAHMVITPGGNTVPLASVGNSVHFYRVGTNAVRIVVNFDSTSTWTGDYISQPTLYWNSTSMFVTTNSAGAFQLPAGVRLLSVNNNSKTIAYNSGTGAVTWTTGYAAVILI